MKVFSDYLQSSLTMTCIVSSFEGYFPSYNVPFFEKIYNMSGYPDMVAKHGVDMSYQLAPRAKIFRRDNGKVVDMDSMKKIMRYNGKRL